MFPASREIEHLTPPSDKTPFFALLCLLPAALSAELSVLNDHLRMDIPDATDVNTQARTEKQESYMKDCCVSVPVPEGFYAELNDMLSVLERLGRPALVRRLLRRLAGAPGGPMGLGSAFMMLLFYPVELLIIAL